MVDQQVKHQGVTVNLGGTDFVIPPLTFRQLQDLESNIASVTNMATGNNLGFGDMQKATPIVLAAIKRNYDSMTEDKLMEILDLVNVREAFGAALGMTADMIAASRQKAMEALSGPGGAQPTPRRVQ